MRPRMRARRSSTDLRAAEVEPETEAGESCVLCGRPIPPDAKASRHHLTPKLKGGAKLPTVLLHQICHSAIHARWSEAELARRLADVDSLRAEPELARFLDWVRTKPPGFHAGTRTTAQLREGRARKR